MGAQESSIYNKFRRLALRYNIENKTYKFLDKGQLTQAPRHPLPKHTNQDFVLSEEELRELHGKSEQLYEYLKKVYLTSTSKFIGTPSKTPRPKPKKENEALKVSMFYEPPNASPGHCTLSKAVEILIRFQQDPENWSASATARELNLDKKDVVNFTMYYSLFAIEKFDFMKAEPKEDKESTEIESGIFNQLRKPLKKIGAK